MCFSHSAHFCKSHACIFANPIPIQVIRNFILQFFACNSNSMFCPCLRTIPTQIDVELRKLGYKEKKKESKVLQNVHYFRLHFDFSWVNRIVGFSCYFRKKEGRGSGGGRGGRGGGGYAKQVAREMRSTKACFRWKYVHKGQEEKGPKKNNGEKVSHRRRRYPEKGPENLGRNWVNLTGGAGIFIKEG